MAFGDLILGGIVATDWQIPAKLRGVGGRQRMAVNKVIGGQRMIDTLGPDDAEIRWTGRFRGAAALQNAQAWDAMRIAGRQVPLLMLGMFRMVVIGEFIFEPEKPYEITYSIRCVVATNPMQGLLQPSFGSLDTLVGGDMNSVTSIASTGADVEPVTTPAGSGGIGAA